MATMTLQYRIAVLDRPAEAWSRPGALDLFGTMVALKLAGYWTSYEPSVLPVDGSDFYSTHFLVGTGDEGSGPFRAIMGFRFTTLAQCLRHQVKFPALALAEATPDPRHAAAVSDILDRCERAGRAIAYAGSWTIAPDVVEGRDDLRDLTAAGIYLLHTHFRVEEAIAGGTLRFKTDRLFRSWGFDAIADDRGPLPPLQVAHLAGEDVLLMHTTAFTDTAVQAAERWRQAWEQRIVVAPEPRVVAE